MHQFKSRIAVLALAVALIGGEAIASEIRSDERVIFFPTMGRLSCDGEECILPIHGWILEPEEDSFFRERTLDWAADALDLPAGSDQLLIFRERVRWFLVENERGKEIVVDITGAEQALSRSTPDGHFSDEIRLPRDVVAAHANGGWLPFRAQVEEDDNREFAGRVHLLEPEGCTPDPG